MSFESHILAWAIPVLAIALSLLHALNLVRRSRAIQNLGHAGTVALMANSLSTRNRNLRALLSVLALVLCLAALARPTSEGKASWRQRGIDVVFVHDFSRSMLASDVYPTRLDRSLKVADTLMEGLVADRVGTVVFAGGAVHFPLTHDQVAARLLYQGLRPTDLAPGSDLGQALRLAICVLQGNAAEPGLCELLAPEAGGGPLQGEAGQSGSALSLAAEAPTVFDRARAIVLFSDGEDSEGFGLDEGALAEQLGIELYVVAVGTRAGELIPRLDAEGEMAGWQEGPEGKLQSTQLDEGFLRELAAKTGSGFFSLGEGRWRGDELMAALRELQRGDLDERVVHSRRHIFDGFLFPAFLLLIIEGCLSLRRRRVPLPVAGKARP